MTAGCAQAQVSYSDGQAIIPVFGNLAQYGHYFVDLFVGQQGQRTSAKLDTQASVLSFACTGSNSTLSEEHHHLDQPFDESHSSPVSCRSACPCDPGAPFCHAQCFNNQCTVYHQVEEKFEKYFGYLARCEDKICITTLKI